MLSPPQLVTIIFNLMSHFIVALLVCYLILQWQSNLLAPYPVAVRQHTLRFRDVRVISSALFVKIISAKTCFSSSPPLVFRLAFNALPCSRMAWQLYAPPVKPVDDDPAFILPRGPFLMIKCLTQVLTRSIKSCDSVGLSLKHILAAGTWKSKLISY